MKPMFFVVGAPRCGTTTLCRVLAAHPEICMSKPKEPHFFTQARPEASEQETRDTYFRLFFSHLAPQHRIMGEGSVSYLYAPEAIRQTKALFPGSKYIVCVRNPVEMVYSYHGRLVSHMDEDIADFRTAWDMQDARAAGKHVPSRCRDPRILQYAMIGRLGEHVERLLELVGEEHCRIVLFDDIREDPQKAYQGVMQFLGVSDIGEIPVRRFNRHKALRHPWLYGLLVRPPRPVQQMIAAATGSRHKVPEFLRPLRRRVKRITRIPAKREAMDEETRAFLRSVYSEEISRLSRVLGRDLGHWH